MQQNKLPVTVAILNNGEKVDTDKYKQYNLSVQLFFSEKTVDYSSLRNDVLLKITTPWVFFLDSDEELSIELINALPQLLSDSHYEGYWISRKTFITPNRYLKYGVFYPDFQLRLFRVNSMYVYTGAVHETINIPHNKTKDLKLDILHYPRNPKYTKFADFKNMRPYIEIETMQLLKKEKSPFLYLKSGLMKSIPIFFSGFFRGKGFLDGWAGFRAHVLFSLSIMMPYFLAAKAKFGQRK